MEVLAIFDQESNNVPTTTHHQGKTELARLLWAASTPHHHGAAEDQVLLLPKKKKKKKQELILRTITNHPPPRRRDSSSVADAVNLVQQHLILVSEEETLADVRRIVIDDHIMVNHHITVGLDYHHLLSDADSSSSCCSSYYFSYYCEYGKKMVVIPKGWEHTVRALNYQNKKLTFGDEESVKKDPPGKSSMATPRQPPNQHYDSGPTDVDKVSGVGSMNTNPHYNNNNNNNNKAIVASGGGAPHSIQIVGGATGGTGSTGGLVGSCSIKRATRKVEAAAMAAAGNSPYDIIGSTTDVDHEEIIVARTMTTSAASSFSAVVPYYHKKMRSVASSSIGIIRERISSRCRSLDSDWYSAWDDDDDDDSDIVTEYSSFNKNDNFDDMCKDVTFDILEDLDDLFHFWSHHLCSSNSVGRTTVKTAKATNLVTKGGNTKKRLELGSRRASF